MKRLKFVFWGVVILFLNAVLVVQIPGAMGDPVPGAEIYIKQEPSDAPVGNAQTDGEGKFNFQGLCGLSAGEYSLNFDLKKVDEKTMEAIKKKKYFHVFIEIGKYVGPENRKLVFFQKKVIIRIDKICLKGKNEAFRFFLKEDILFNIMPKQTRATGHKGGFAVGGFSLS